MASTHLVARVSLQVEIVYIQLPPPLTGVIVVTVVLAEQERYLAIKMLDLAD